MTNGKNLTLYLSRQSGIAEFEYSATDDLYVYNLSNIKPPTSDTGTPFVSVGELSQNATYNASLNRVELTPQHYAALDSSQQTFTAYVRSQFTTILGTIWMYSGSEAPNTYTVTYIDGTGTETAFPNQVYPDVTEGNTTPAFIGTPTRDGYTFAGWNPTIATTVTQNVTYTAQWEAIPATVVTPPNTAPELADTGVDSATNFTLLLAAMALFAGCLTLALRTHRSRSVR